MLRITAKTKDIGYSHNSKFDYLIKTNRLVSKLIDNAPLII